MSEDVTVQEFLAAGHRLLTLLRSGKALPLDQQKLLNDRIQTLHREWSKWMNWRTQ